MSFGIGIGDCLALSKLGLEIWVRMQKSPERFETFRNEFRGFYIVLDDLNYRTQGLKLDENKTAHLSQLIQVFQKVLNDTSDVIDKFERPGNTTSALKGMAQKTLNKLTWNETDINGLRTRISTNTSILNTFLDGLTRFVISPSNGCQLQRLMDSSGIAQSTNEKVTEIDEKVQDLKLYNDDQERRQILDKISTLTFATQQSVNLDQREGGTGQWFLDSREFQEWTKSSQRTLFCTGMPGAGKTILASIAIENLINTCCSKQNTGVAYIFCDYKAETDGADQTPQRLLASLLKQFLQQRRSVPDHIRDLYSEGVKNHHSNLNGLSQSLRLVADSFSQVYIVVDALDELPQGGCVVQGFLSCLLALQTKSRVNLLLTSRDIPHITNLIKSDMRVEMRASNEDVMEYLDGRMSQLPMFIARSEDLKQKIMDAIVSVVDGMFLLARLHLESLFDKMNAAEVRKALECLPKGNEALSGAYHQVMKRIQAQKQGYKGLAQKALGWITYAKRPLSLDEMRYALAIQPGASEFDIENLCDLDEIISACGGLVVVERGHARNLDQDVEFWGWKDVVRLVHHSTQQFLMQNDKEYLLDAQPNIAVSCLTYLLQIFIPFAVLKAAKYKDDIASLLTLHPFLLYAAQHWAAHASKCLEKLVMKLTLQFLQDDFKVSVAAKVLLVLGGYARYSHAEFWGDYCRLQTPTLNPVRGIHLAIFYGFENIFLMLLDNGFGADASDPFNRTPLYWAASLGRTSFVKKLLSMNKATAHWEKGDDENEAVSGFSSHGNVVDVNVQDSTGTPLSWAADRGHLDVVTQLLEQEDINPNLGSEKGWTPLICAAHHGHEAVVRCLVACTDVDVNQGAFVSTTALARAVRGHHETVLRFLLSNPSIDVNAKDNKGRTPLIIAAINDYAYAAELLLLCPSINLNSKDCDGRTALAMAGRFGVEVPELLLACPAIDVNSKDKDGLTPIMMADRLEVYPTFKAIVELLLARDDIDLGCVDNEGNDLLSTATEYAHSMNPRIANVGNMFLEAIEKRGYSSKTRGDEHTIRLWQPQACWNSIGTLRALC